MRPVAHVVLVLALLVVVECRSPVIHKGTSLPMLLSGDITFSDAFSHRMQCALTVFQQRQSPKIKPASFTLSKEYMTRIR
jgi:hypothetical protein